MSAEHIEAEIDLFNVVQFLCGWPTDKVHLTAIHPDKPGIIAHSFGKDDDSKRDMMEWLRRAVKCGYGVYANYNDLCIDLSTKGKRKAGEADVSRLVAFHCDADVDKSITDPTAFEIAKAALLERIQTSRRPPTHVIDSGNGFAIFGC